jgi:hypothetical protein
VPADEVGTVRVSAEARLRVREIQLELADLGAAFPGMVLMSSGALSGRCPVTATHTLVAVIDDDGALLLSCGAGSSASSCGRGIGD